MGERARILLVEDDVTLQKMIVDLLDADVTIAEDGEQCMSTLKSQPRGQFDLLLLDILLPKRSGISVLRAVKEDYPEMPVIVITGYTEMVEQQVTAMGVDKLLAKPFKYDDLRSAVEAVLAKRKGKE